MLNFNPRSSSLIWSIPYKTLTFSGTTASEKELFSVCNIDTNFPSYWAFFIISTYSDKSKSIWVVVTRLTIISPEFLALRIIRFLK